MAPGGEVGRPKRHESACDTLTRNVEVSEQGQPGASWPVGSLVSAMRCVARGRGRVTELAPSRGRCVAWTRKW